MENGNRSVTEVCYETGYEDLSYFRQVFKRHTGLTPSSYKKRLTFPQQ